MKPYLFLIFSICYFLPLYSQDLDTYNFIDSDVPPFDFSTAVDVEVDNNNNIYVLARADDDGFVTSYLGLNNDNHIVVIKYLATGELDTNFGNGGFFTMNFGILNNSLTSSDFVEDFAILNNDKIVIVGHHDILDPNTRNTFVIQLTLNGELDTSFNTTGYRLFADNLATSVKITSNNKILVGGGTSSNISLIKLNSDGSLDTSFGTQGISLIDGNTISNISEPNLTYYIRDFTITNNNEIVSLLFNESSSALVRFTANGMVDTSYGTGGGLIVGQGNFESFYSARKLFKTSDDSVYVRLYYYCFGCSGFSASNLIKKYTPQGTLDTSLDTYYNGNTHLLEDLNQNIYITFTRNTSTQTRFGVAKFTNNGSIDASFRTNGEWVSAPTTASEFRFYPVKTISHLSSELLILGYRRIPFPGGSSTYRTITSIYSSLAAQSNLSVNKFDNASTFVAYPNPSDGIIYFETDTFYTPKKVTVTSIHGEKILEKTFTSVNAQIDISTQPNGIYFVTIAGESKTYKIIKE
jgi:uncharacterized delta-60 repeat protein